MVPTNILGSNQPEVLRAALRLMDAQLTVAMRTINTMAGQIEKLGGKTVVQLALDSINAADVAPLPTPSTNPTDLELAAQGQPVASPSETDPAPESKKRKAGHGPKKQPSLETVARDYVLDPPDCMCPECGRMRSPIPDQCESSEMIDVVEMKVELVTVKRAKYNCTCGSAIETAIGPTRATPGGRYSLAFAVYIAVQKYLYHMPLERQVRLLRDSGLEVSSQVLWDQILALLRFLRPTVTAIQAAILKEPVIGVDQTGWKNLKERGAKHYQLWGLSSPTLLYYEICTCKGLESFNKVLGDYSGTIVCDEAGTHGAAARRNSKLLLAACWAHVLRRFRDARKAFPEAERPMRLIKRFYEIDAAATTLEARTAARAIESTAVAAELKAWLDARAAIPTQTSLGSAIRYASGAWAHLTHFLTDGRVWLDNNRTESQLRGPVVGRKNHYGSKSNRGTEVAAVFYTILESAKLVGVPPAGYLRAILEAATAYGNDGKAVVLLPAEYAKTLKTPSL